MSAIPWITLSYVHAKTHAYSLKNLKFVGLKQAGFCCLRMIIANLSLFFVKGGEAAGNQRLSKSKKWYCHTSRMAVWCLFKRGGKRKKNGPGDWIISSCQYVLVLPPPSLQQHVLFSALLFSVTHIPEPCAAQLGFRSLKHGPSGHENQSCNALEIALRLY